MIYAKVAPAQFEGIRDWLAAQEGIVATGNKGVIQGGGVTATYDFDGVGQLQIQVTHKPFFLPIDLVEGKIRDGLRQHGAVVA